MPTQEELAAAEAITAAEGKLSETPEPIAVIETPRVMIPVRSREAVLDRNIDEAHEEMWEKLIEEAGDDPLGVRVYEKDELSSEERYVKGGCLKYNPKTETMDQLIERIGNTYPDISFVSIKFLSPKTAKRVRELRRDVRFAIPKAPQTAPVVAQQLPPQITVEMSEFKHGLLEITRTQEMFAKNQSDLLAVMKDNSERQARVQEEMARKNEEYLKEQNKQSREALTELVRTLTAPKSTGGLEEIEKVLKIMHAVNPPNQNNDTKLILEAIKELIPRQAVDPANSVATSLGLITKIMEFTEEMRGRVNPHEIDEQPDDRRGFNVQRFIGSLESEISKVVGTGLGKTIQNQIAPIVSKIAIGGKTTNEEKVQPDAGRQLQSLLIEIEKRCSTQTPEEIVKWGKESGILAQITPEVIAGLKKTEWGIVRDQLGTIRPSILSHEPKLKKIVELL